jgi:hypothetical protein
MNRQRVGRSGRDHKTLASILVVGLAVALVVVRPLDAQRPARPLDLQAPGGGIVLKAGWQLLVHDECRFAVPPTWRASGDGSLAPDGSNFSVGTFKIKSWSAHKAQIRAAFGRVNVVHEDNDRRLWFEIGDKQRTQHVIDVASGSSACLGILEIRPTATLNAEDVKSVVDSIGPAPARWPPDPK